MLLVVMSADHCKKKKTKTLIYPLALDSIIINLIT